MRMRGCIALLALPALFAGCEFTRDPVAIGDTETQFGVFGVLTAGTDTASVIVASFRPAPPIDHPGWDGVGGATVYVIAGSDTIQLIEQPIGNRSCATGMSGVGPPGPSGCYRAVIPGGIQAGATYGLVANLPTFGRIVGSAQVPHPPVILSPAEGERVPVEDSFSGLSWLDLRIQPGARTARLEASIGDRDTTRNCDVRFIGNSITLHSTIILSLEDAGAMRVPFEARCLSTDFVVPVGELPAAVRVMALDSTYARFAETVIDDADNALQSRYTRAGIDRGVGYFVGAAVAERRIVLVSGG